MSRALLEFLNGGNQGLFRSLLDTLGADPNIVWYPSANDDFRPLLFLSPQYAKIYPSSEQKDVFPDIFLFTDYFPWRNPPFLDNPLIYKDNRTKVIIKEMELLPNLPLPLDPDILHFPNPVPVAYGKVIYFLVEVESILLGALKYPVLYVFNENEAFCSKILLQYNARITHVIRKRYGSGWGGGYANGLWLLGILKKLRATDFLFVNIPDRLGRGDEAALRLYPNLWGAPPRLIEFRKVYKSELIWCKVE